MLVVNKRTGQVEEFSTFEHYETFAEEFEIN
jgi:hypothetical protein